MNNYFSKLEKQVCQFTIWLKLIPDVNLFSFSDNFIFRLTWLTILNVSHIHVLYTVFHTWNLTNPAALQGYFFVNCFSINYFRKFCDLITSSFFLLNMEDCHCNILFKLIFYPTAWRHLAIQLAFSSCQSLLNFFSLNN